MNFYDSEIFNEDMINTIELTVGIEKLKNSSIMVTGATGLIGSYIVDVLLEFNQLSNANIVIYALGRSEQRLSSRFDNAKTRNLIYVEHDVNNEIRFNYDVDYIIHAASNAYPAAFNSDPVGTIMSNILGTQQLLAYSKYHKVKRFMFISSGEVYGQGDVSLDTFTEEYSGYINPIHARSCYPVSKRAAETLCVAYTKQYGVDTVIARPCHTYGPNATTNDNRANVQFVNNALQGEDIILNSDGRQLRSYCYIADVASAIFTILINGKSAEAYNIANPEAKVTIAEFASIVAAQVGKKVIFVNSDEKSMEEGTPIIKQVLNSKKLVNLGRVIIQ